MAAANICHAATPRQRLVSSGDRRYPVRDQIGNIAGAIEALRTMKDLVVVLVPRQPLAGSKRLLQRWRDGPRACRRLEGAHDERGAAFLGEQQGLLRRQRVRSSVRV